MRGFPIPGFRGRTQSAPTTREISRQLWADTYTEHSARLFDQAQAVVLAIQEGRYTPPSDDPAMTRQITAARQRRAGFTRRLDTDLAFLDLREMLAHNEEFRQLHEQYGAALESAARQILAERELSVPPPVEEQHMERVLLISPPSAEQPRDQP